MERGAGRVRGKRGGGKRRGGRGVGRLATSNLLLIEPAVSLGDKDWKALNRVEVFDWQLHHFELAVAYVFRISAS